MRRAMLILAASALSLGACSAITNDVKETLGTPKQAPMNYPSALMPTDQKLLNPPDSDTTPASPNSLWRTGARTFFHDQRARRVGDILTVNVAIADNATVSNETNRNRTSSATAGVPHLFGLESSLGKIPGSSSGANLVGLSGADSSDGKGSITRQEVINLTIAAVVTGVLPNGNLIIQGRQEVTTNNEMRELTVSGIVRPEDISNTNTINHTQIAEARIVYGGKGDVSRIQKAPAAQALVEKYSPF
jgi:flagellar L-ring protein precursor FlgH